MLQTVVNSKITASARTAKNTAAGAGTAVPVGTAKSSVDSYFIKQKPRTALEQLQLQNQAILKVNEKVDSVKQDLEEFKQDMPLLAVECERITEAVHKRGVAALGGKESAAYNDASLRGKVYSDIYRELKRQFGVASYKAIKRSQCDHVISVIDDYEVPYVLSEQVSDCNAQISMRR